MVYVEKEYYSNLRKLFIIMLEVQPNKYLFSLNNLLLLLIPKKFNLNKK